MKNLIIILIILCLCGCKEEPAWSEYTEADYIEAIQKDIPIKTTSPVLNKLLAIRDKTVGGIEIEVESDEYAHSLVEIDFNEPNESNELVVLKNSEGTPYLCLDRIDALEARVKALEEHYNPDTGDWVEINAELCSTDVLGISSYCNDTKEHQGYHFFTMNAVPNAEPSMYCTICVRAAWAEPNETKRLIKFQYSTDPDPWEYLEGEQE